MEHPNPAMKPPDPVGTRPSQPVAPDAAAPVDPPSARDGHAIGPRGVGSQGEGGTAGLDLPPVVVAGGGIVGTAVAFVLQRSVPVVLVEEGDFPGLGETRDAVGILKAVHGHPVLDAFARRTWAFAVAQHRHPRSPLRLTFARLDGRPGRAAFLDHLLLLDAMFLAARRAGLRLLTRTRVVAPVLAGDRVVGVRLERAGSGGGEAARPASGGPAEGWGDVVPASALVLAPGPRPDSLAMDGLPTGFAGRFVPVKDVVIPFRLPAEVESEPAVFTRRSLIWRFALGTEARTLLAAARLEGDWAPPSFEELVTLVEDLVARFDLTGEAQLDRVRTLIDLRGPDGLPFVGAVAPWGGAHGLFVVAGLGLEGLSTSLGAAHAIAAAVLEDLAQRRLIPTG
ncbi:MAG TPA: FAD-dependent oxidoreductase [Thermaerobacter sp.]